MHFKYIVICAILLFVMIGLYVNINTDMETEVDLQFVGTGILDVKEKHEPVIHTAQVVLPTPTKKIIQIGMEELTELSKNSDYVESEPECESFIKIGEKKTCLAQYSGDEENDMDYLADESFKNNASKIISPPQKNDPLPIVVIKSNSLESEQIFEGFHPSPGLN